MDHPALASLSHYYFGAKPYYNETHGGLSFTLSDTESFTAQELTAMMFNYAKDITKAFGGKEVKDCVITVPSFYTAHERRAIMSAAKIANLKVRVCSWLRRRGVSLRCGFCLEFCGGGSHVISTAHKLCAGGIE